MGSQAHNVRALGILGEGVDPLDPANVERAYAIEADKLEDIQNVVITTTGELTPLRPSGREGRNRPPAAVGEGWGGG